MFKCLTKIYRSKKACQNFVASRLIKLRDILPQLDVKEFVTNQDWSYNAFHDSVDTCMQLI